MLQPGGLSPERLRQAIDTIGRNARLQTQLIEDMLDVSRIITGKLEISRLPVLVPHLIDTVVNGMLPAAAAKRIALTKTVAADLPPLEGDPQRLHQVLANVLSNAIKFTPEGGRVDVRSAVEGGSIEIEVRDSGIGIEPEFLPYVFDRFRQADSRSTRKHGGLGLGLAIARHLLEQHGGDIHARSSGSGRGTVVTMRLPVRPFDHAQPAITRTWSSQPAVELRLDGTTVVVVDDEPDSRELLGALFEDCGARVLQCSTADSALNALASSVADLIVADIAMPEVDGYELIRRVRARSGSIPAIAVSAYARPEDRGRALASGYNGYCAKPVDAQRFLGIVRDVMLST